MSQKTHIQWTDHSSNPIRYRDADGKVVWACAKVSDGCKNCYSETIANRYRKGGPFTLQQVRKVTPFFDDGEARKLLRSKTLAGKRVFIGDMTDVFGEWVPFEILDKLFAVFALRPDVTFQVLTKRPERMAEYLNRIQKDADDDSDNAGELLWAAIDEYEKYWPDWSVWSIRRGRGGLPFSLPLPNVWLGTSIENRDTLDARVMALSACPAAVHFWSLEPLLEDLGNIRGYLEQNVSWVIIGGESGGMARPCGVNWVRNIVRQCRGANVPVFVKQLGLRPQVVAGTEDFHYLAGVEYVEKNIRLGAPATLKLRNRKGGDPSEWPDDLRMREFPAAAVPA